MWGVPCGMRPTESVGTGWGEEGGGGGEGGEGGGGRGVMGREEE